jgi:hypothetical protein
MSSSDSSSNVAANDTSNVNVLQSKQVAPLPIGPGGSNSTKIKMNATNEQLTMLAAQATANTLYDPPVPKPVTQQLVQPFCSGSNDPFPYMIIIIAGLFIVRGLISK